MTEQTLVYNKLVQTAPLMTKEGFYIADAEELAEMQHQQLKKKKERKRKQEDSCSEEEVLQGITMDSISTYVATVKN